MIFEVTRSPHAAPATTTDHQPIIPFSKAAAPRQFHGRLLPPATDGGAHGGPAAAGTGNRPARHRPRYAIPSTCGVSSHMNVVSCAIAHSPASTTGEPQWPGDAGYVPANGKCRDAYHDQRPRHGRGHEHAATASHGRTPNVPGSHDAARLPAAHDDAPARRRDGAAAYDGGRRHGLRLRRKEGQARREVLRNTVAPD